MFGKFIDSKRDSFVFGIKFSKAFKTRAYVFHVEEANFATVVTMNRRRDYFSLKSELSFLRHYGCSVSNELITTVIIIVEVPISN